MVALSAVCLIAALAAPTAGAAGAHKSGAASAAKKSANAPASQAQSRRTLARRINSVRRRTTRAERRLRTLGQTVSRGVAELRGLITAGDTAIDNKINTIVATVTPILTQMGEGLVALRDGALQLKAGLETLATATQDGFDQVETAITQVATSQEYGVVRVFFGPGGAGGNSPLSLPSADIPDDGNGVPAGGELPLIVGAPGQPPENTLMTLRASIRSGETDGTDGGDPAGYVGGLITMKCAGGAGAGGACDTDPAGGHGDTPAALRPAGAIVCVVGPPPAQNIDLPNGTTGSFPIVEIPEKVGRTDLTHPDASIDETDVNPVEGASAGSGSVVGPLADDASDGCRTGESGDTYTLLVQTQFFDLPTSLTPGPTD